jgi:hypothetical protein
MSELLTAEERQAMRESIYRGSPTFDDVLRALDDIDARERQNVELDKWACRRITELETALATAERERDEARADYRALAKEYGRG